MASQASRLFIARAAAATKTSAEPKLERRHRRQIRQGSPWDTTNFIFFSTRNLAIFCQCFADTFRGWRMARCRREVREVRRCDEEGEIER